MVFMQVLEVTVVSVAASKSFDGYYDNDGGGDTCSGGIIDSGDGDFVDSNSTSVRDVDGFLPKIYGATDVRMINSVDGRVK